MVIESADDRRMSTGGAIAWVPAQLSAVECSAWYAHAVANDLVGRGNRDTASIEGGECGPHRKRVAASTRGAQLPTELFTCELLVKI